MLNNNAGLGASRLIPPGTQPPARTGTTGANPSRKTEVSPATAQRPADSAQLIRAARKRRFVLRFAGTGWRLGRSINSLSDATGARCLVELPDNTAGQLADRTKVVVGCRSPKHGGAGFAVAQ